MLELGIGGGGDSEDGNSEDSRVLRQAGDRAGLQGPGHLSAARTYRVRN